MGRHRSSIKHLMLYSLHNLIWEDTGVVIKHLMLYSLYNLIWEDTDAVLST